MTARTELIRCSPEVLFAVLEEMPPRPAIPGPFGAGPQAELLTADPPNRARLVRRSSFGLTHLDVTVNRGAHCSITQVRCEADRGPVTRLPGPIRHLMTGNYAEQLLSDLHDAVRRRSAAGADG
jgi:hypothetical protein